MGVLAISWDGILFGVGGLCFLETWVKKIAETRFFSDDDDQSGWNGVPKFEICFILHLPLPLKNLKLLETDGQTGQTGQAEAGNFPFCTIDPNMGKAKAEFFWRRL